MGAGRYNWLMSRRTAARVVLLDSSDRIFLINAIDPYDSAKGDWWEIPGGGMEGNEASEDAVRRELREEAGVDDAEIGPVIWTQQVEYDFAGMHFAQDEFLHIARWTGTEQKPLQLEYFEALAFRGAYWWPLDELLAAEGIKTLPPRLREFLPAIVGGDIPSEPIDITGSW